MRGPRQLIVVGGGEHARVVVEAARSRPAEWSVQGFLDPLPCEETQARLSLERLGDDREAARFEGAWLVLGIGDPQRRREAVARMPFARWAIVVHERAWVSPSATLAPGTVAMAGAVVNACAYVGEHCVINSGALLEHDVQVAAYVHVGPGAAVGGGASIGAGSQIGLGARIRDHVRVGANAMVGMGAVVLEPVGDGCTVFGVPARERTDG